MYKVHTCTCVYIFVCTCYRHVHRRWYMYGHCTDTAGSVEPWHFQPYWLLVQQGWRGLIQLGHLSTLHQQLFIPCTYTVHTVYIYGSYIDLLCTCAQIIQCLYHWGNFHCKLACNPFMIGLDSAYRQESANRYIHGLSVSVLVKNGTVHMVSFPVTFFPKYV